MSSRATRTAPGRLRGTRGRALPPRRSKPGARESRRERGFGLILARASTKIRGVGGRTKYSSNANAMPTSRSSSPRIELLQPLADGPSLLYVDDVFAPRAVADRDNLRPSEVLDDIDELADGLRQRHRVALLLPPVRAREDRSVAPALDLVRVRDRVGDRVGIGVRVGVGFGFGL